jgi:4-diphosphocytidyl-2-C-methyl-D-erythritol kinase
MDVYRHGAGFWAHAPAKLNLYFEVLARRADGFHEIETLMVPIGLCDTVRLHLSNSSAIESGSPQPITLHANWASPDLEWAFGQLPPSEQNLVTRALTLLQARSGTKVGADVELTKRIPAAAGLGGGSSDAAAALKLANIAWGLNWRIERLAQVAAEIGSDVPFFLHRGPALCRGRGEIIEPVPRLPSLNYVIVRPPVGLSTPEVYRACKPANGPAGVGPLLGAIRSGSLRDIALHMTNRLQPAAAALTDRIDRLKHAFTSLGCQAAQLSGSGSSFFGICRHSREARRLAALLRNRRLGHVYAVAG